MRTAARVVVGAASLVALLLGIATAHERGVGGRAVIDSDAALARGDLIGAVARARDAAEAAAPGSPYPAQGFGRLESIARAAESRGDERTAVAAWGALRAATTATSGPLSPNDSWRALADEGLVRAGARPLVPTAEVHARDVTVRAALTGDDSPASATLALLGLGALAFFAGCARLAFAAPDLASLRRERLALLAASAGAILYVVTYLRA